ncbi:hypothetical protein KEJ15_07620 [Candidatus Bathyarchaeota archaeon]|nr:hypothetical protein [Candidatus Bathyarchaeota archaeon]
MSEPSKKVNLVEPITVDSIAVRRDHYFPGAYIIDFPLDFTPDHVWQDIFEREWKSSRHLWDRKIFVIGNKLRLVTTASDIEDKVDWIKQIIERTNLGIELYNKETEARKVEKEEKTKQAPEEERVYVDVIRETLKKKFSTV